MTSSTEGQKTFVVFCYCTQILSLSFYANFCYDFSILGLAGSKEVVCSVLVCALKYPIIYTCNDRLMYPVILFSSQIDCNLFLQLRQYKMERCLKKQNHPRRWEIIACFYLSMPKSREILVHEAVAYMHDSMLQEIHIKTPTKYQILSLDKTKVV